MARWRTGAAMALFLVLFTFSVATTRVPYIAPLSFIIVAMIAWDYGLRPALVWIAVFHIINPCVFLLLGTGPFFVFVEARGLVAVIMLGTVTALTGLAFLTDRVHLLTKELHASRSAILEVNEKLQAALDEVKELRGLLPVCAWCKNVKDVDGGWEAFETYIARNSRATISHGLCPKCLKEQIRIMN